MARMKMCRCGKLIGYDLDSCDRCAIDIAAEKAESNRQYDRYYRDRDATAFYESVEWKKIRVYVLSKYKGLDLYAFFIEDKIVLADTVHHIIELRDDWTKRIDIENLIPMSSATHNKIHKLYNKNKKEKDKTIKLLFNLKKKWDKLYG